MHLMIGFLSLLLAAPSFEGKWKGEIPGPGGDKLSMICELKADGTAEMTVSDKDGKALGSRPAKWKKVTDKTMELTIDGTPKPGKGELLDEKTLEIGDADGKDKVKFTRQ